MVINAEFNFAKIAVLITLNKYVSSLIFDNVNELICSIVDKSPDKFTLEMPQMFEQLPVQVDGLKFVIPCHSRFAGVIIYYPFSQAMAYGI